MKTDNITISARHEQVYEAAVREEAMWDELYANIASWDGRMLGAGDERPLSWITPFGKPLRDCTLGEVKLIARFFKAVGAYKIHLGEAN